MIYFNSAGYFTIILILDIIKGRVGEFENLAKKAKQENLGEKVQGSEQGCCNWKEK